MATTNELLATAAAAHESAAQQMQALLDGLAGMKWMAVSDVGEAAQTILTDELTLVNNMVFEAGNLPSSQWNGTVFTVGAGQAGMWFIDNGINILEETGESHEIWVNGSLLPDGKTTFWAPTGAGIANRIPHLKPWPLEDGDQVSLYYEQYSGVSRSSNGNRAFFLRLPG